MQCFPPRRPYHNLPNDLLTAYVHFVAIQGWLFWRRNLKDPKLLAVIDGLHNAPQARAARYRKYVRLFCTTALVIMIGMSLIVLGGFALPAQIEGSGDADFQLWHAVVMWPAIPPVICCLFCVYAMLFFMCMHITC